MSGKIVNCIVCGTSTRAGLSPWHSCCPSCDYQHADLKPTINEKPAHDRINETDREKSLKALRLENFTTIVERISHLVAPGTASLLDVGSAHGWFLEAASGRFKVLGVEPDWAVGCSAATRGLPVRRGYFPDALQAGEQFDVIVFNDVVEHIPDVQSAIKSSREHLTDGGLLVLNLPSSRGFFYRLSNLLAMAGWHGPFERMWQKGLPSPHIHYFNAENLSSFVSRLGFEPVQSFELPAVRSSGLMERLRVVGHVNRFALYAQYLIVRCSIPLLSLFPSDIVVCIARKR